MHNRVIAKAGASPRNSFLLRRTDSVSLLWRLSCPALSLPPPVPGLLLLALPPSLSAFPALVRLEPPPQPPGVSAPAFENKAPRSAKSVVWCTKAKALPSPL